MASFTICADQFVDRPVDEVFAYVCGQYFTSQPLWDPVIIELTPTLAGPIGVGARAQITRRFRGKSQHGESEILELAPNRSILVENRYPKDIERRRISCLALRGGGTRLRVEIVEQVGFIAGLIAPLTTDVAERGLVLSLRSVKTAIEGQTTPDR